MKDPTIHLTEHFTCDELASPDTGECNMDADFMKSLEDLRVRCGFGMMIPTSGYRTLQHNAEVGGADLSFHQGGLAVDIDHTRWTGFMRHNFVAHATAMGFSIGVYRKHFHIDRRNSPAVLWVEPSKV